MDQEYPYSVGNTRLPEECPFCRQAVLDRQRVFGGEHHQLLYSQTPAVEGTLLLIPKRHVIRLEELSFEEHIELHQILMWIPRLFREVYGVDQYLMLQKNGKYAGQTVAHIHFHIMPMKKGSLQSLTEAFVYRTPISDREMRTQVAQIKKGVKALFSS